MTEYQTLARKYRPQTFREILGQSHIVTTLKNAIKRKRTAHAYLFCGSRGTGKTTLARVFAKALNCENPQNDEPCNVCSSCKEIMAGSSLDIIEIDGASHRGIDDIRQINETVGYAASSGKFKIYIIDEVHMLTKEAFNALLKTLEEPPPKVKFIFATTEPHKVLPTILSRCQRFNLNRISMLEIMGKLAKIANDLNISIEDGALRLIAGCAEGGLRDAESLFDQIIAFHDDKITEDSVADVLGMMPKDAFFSLDKAGKEGNLAIAFTIAHQVFSEGKDVLHFLDSLIEHFRTLLIVKLCGPSASFLTLSDKEREQYEISAKLYTQEQCLTIIDSLLETQEQRSFSNSKIALEGILLRVLRTHQRIPLDYLVRRLVEIEQRLADQPAPQKQLEPAVAPAIPAKKVLGPQDGVVAQTVAQISVCEMKSDASLGKKELAEIAPVALTLPSVTVTASVKAASQTITEDPSPAPADLPKLPKPSVAQTVAQISVCEKEPVEKKPLPQQKSRHDTILQFAAVELEGTIRKTKKDY